MEIGLLQHDLCFFFFQHKYEHKVKNGVQLLLMILQRKLNSQMSTKIKVSHIVQRSFNYINTNNTNNLNKYKLPLKSYLAGLPYSHDLVKSPFTIY